MFAEIVVSELDAFARQAKTVNTKSGIYSFLYVKGILSGVASRFRCRHSVGRKRCWPIEAWLSSKRSYRRESIGSQLRSSCRRVAADSGQVSQAVAAYTTPGNGIPASGEKSPSHRSSSRRSVLRYENRSTADRLIDNFLSINFWASCACMLDPSRDKHPVTPIATMPNKLTPGHPHTKHPKTSATTQHRGQQTPLKPSTQSAQTSDRT